MSESLPYDKNDFDNNVNLEVLITVPDDSNGGYFVEVDLIYPDELKEKN